MTDPDLPRSDWDERLTQLLREDSPAPPDVLARVRRRLAFRRAARVGLAAVVLLTLGAVAFWRPRAGDPAPSAAEFPAPDVLFAGPPVDPFDVLARQQEAYLTALELPEEKTP